jgi:hypothetical protein
MSYESQLDHQSSRIISPTQLCLLLSIALHLLALKFGLPTFKFNDDDGKREVSIVELNPEQQARLPDLKSELPEPKLPDFNDPAFKIPPNLLPGNTDPANLPPLIIPPPPQFNGFPPLPPVNDINLPPVGNWSNLPVPPQINPDDFKVEPIKIPANFGKLPQPPSQPSAIKTPPNSSIAQPQTSPASPQTQLNNNRKTELTVCDKFLRQLKRELLMRKLIKIMLPG